MIGNLFVFEGADGVGKTSIIDLLYNELIKKRILVKKIGFPGYEKGTLGHLINNIHKSPRLYDLNSIDPTSLQLLHVAAHIDSINRVVLPELKLGTIILLDRFWWSTHAYGKISGIDETILNQMIEIEIKYWEGIQPSKLFLMNRIRIPLKEDIDIQLWNKIKCEYETLSNSGKCTFPITKIDNETSLEVTFSLVLKEILNIIK